MTPKSRLLTTLKNQKADHVPASPDFWEMIPIRFSGKKSWEILVYQDPPIWKATIDVCIYFGVDAFVPTFIPFEDDQKTAVVFSDENKLITRQFSIVDGCPDWSLWVQVYKPSEPSAVVLASSMGFGRSHDKYEIVKPNTPETGREHYRLACECMGDKGLILPTVCLPALGHSIEEMYEFYDNPEAVTERINKIGKAMMCRVKEIISWKPEAIMIGNSGLMLFNPPHIFRKLAIDRWFKKVTQYAKQNGVLTHIHCCGPERALVEIASEKTDLTSIEPLEIPPMGDCDLRDIKENFGHKLALKGNIHTTDVMLFGKPEKVEQECKKAIDDAANGGGFILSTGDQTPRDTPEENIFTMQKVAETYGRY